MPLLLQFVSYLVLLCLGLLMCAPTISNHLNLYVVNGTCILADRSTDQPSPALCRWHQGLGGGITWGTFLILLGHIVLETVRKCGFGKWIRYSSVYIFGIGCVHLVASIICFVVFGLSVHGFFQFCTDLPCRTILGTKAFHLLLLNFAACILIACIYFGLFLCISIICKPVDPAVAGAQPLPSTDPEFQPDTDMQEESKAGEFEPEPQSADSGE